MRELLIKESAVEPDLRKFNLEHRRFVKVAVDAPLPKPLTYLDEGSEGVVRGQIVQVPLGRRSKLTRGLIVGTATEAEANEFKNLKSISKEMVEWPPLPEPFVKWLEWLSQYYLYPLGFVFSNALPRLGRFTQRKTKHPSPVRSSERTTPPALTTEQAKAVNAITKVLDGFSAHLLLGITGSGKTEVYLRALEPILAAGKKAIVLVPEISLTPQLLSRFANRFGAEKIASLHSQLTDREKTNMWWTMVDGPAQILIGARSALFCPLANLGMIIVDEEQELSFKQEDHLRYHARDAALVLAKLSGCPIILGSATPSLETWQNVLTQKFQVHELTHRAVAVVPPTLEVVDMRGLESTQDLPGWLSPKMHGAIETALAAGKQAALFLNRRGVANLLLCPACGFSFECPNCDINLTLHHRTLVCHYCEYHQSVPGVCPDCKEGELKPIGIGTEKIQSDLAELFPEARIFRADRDEIQSRQDYEKLIEDMEKQNIDILVGTQMIAKGLDFPHLQMVGLVLADIGMNFPDFRAGERMYQLMTQMAGRAGRHVKEGEPPGQVIIQTYNPTHSAVQHAIGSSYAAFAEAELAIRQLFHYPPHGYMIAIKVQSLEKSLASNFIGGLARKLNSLKAKDENKFAVELLGPTESPLSRIKNQYRFHLLLKDTNRQRLHKVCQWLIENEEPPPKVKLVVDVDPMNLL